MTTVIINYGSGNLHSVARAFERMAPHRETVTVSADPDRVKAATRIVLPGVGAFADCRWGLEKQTGLLDALETAVRHDEKPFLGICVGMQLLADIGNEHQSCPGLGWIPGSVDMLAPTDATLKIPHMGWNNVQFEQSHPLTQGLTSQGHAYFVHSYGFTCADTSHCLATTDYGGPITAMIGHKNVAGVQFHPEKSQAFGLGFIANFFSWSP